MPIRPGQILALLLLGPLVAAAQSVRGTVVDRGGVPVAGVVVRLLNEDSTQAARALSNERGEFIIRATRAGTFRLSTLRIGFRPVVSDPIALRAGETIDRRVELTGVPFALGEVRVAGRNSCGRAVGSQKETFELLEQVRAAISATELTAASGLIVTSGVGFSRVLDPAGFRVLAQRAAIVDGVGGQPWVPVAMDTLRRTGYVVELGDSLVYRAPGLETLSSDEFVIDHCFRIVQANDGSQVGIAFEPVRERRVPEMRGTLWLDRATSELRRLEYRYVNIEAPLEDAGAGGDVRFTRTSSGAWAVAGWNIRMPVVELRQAARATRRGRTAPEASVRSITVVGGDLSFVLRAGSTTDTLWSREPLVITGSVVDSVSGAPVADARLSLHGTKLGAFSDARGAFTMQGVLPGNYTLQVRTASLDSVNAVNALAFSFTGGESPIRVRVPNATVVAASMCGAQLANLPTAMRGMLFGTVMVAGDSANAAGANVVVEWTENGADEFRWKEIKADERGGFRACGVPIGRTLVLRAVGDAGGSELVGVMIPAGRRFARTDLLVDSAIAPTGVFAGLVQDSANRPIAGAEVVINGSGVSARTTERGAFRLRDVPVGEREVVVRKPGFGPMTAKLTFAKNQTLSRRVVLSPVTVLEEVRVTAERANDRLMQSFEENRKIGLGKFFTRQELEKYEALDVTHVLEALPSVHILHVAGRAAILQGGRVPGCNATIYLDRHLLYDRRAQGPPMDPVDLSRIMAAEIEAIEYYPGAASLPLEYSGLNNTCSVLVLHTRRPVARSDSSKKPPS